MVGIKALIVIYCMYSTSVFSRDTLRITPDLYACVGAYRVVHTASLFYLSMLCNPVQICGE